jgi:hypothetical protein
MDNSSNKIVYLFMLLQLENTSKESINKLLDFAKQNQLKLSVIDDTKNNFFLPGKPLTDTQLTELIENGRNSWSIDMEHAHSTIRNSFDED